MRGSDFYTRWFTGRVTKGCPPFVAFAIAALALSTTTPARSAEQDLNLWSVFYFGHHFDDNWSASFQTEVRAQDDITDLDAVILKPGLFFHFSEHVSLGAGYKFQAKNQTANENDGWQELYLNHALGEFSFGHQFRLEERVLRDVDGVIARLRYLIHIEHPITDTWYMAGSEAIRFNLNDQGTGPVQGFEQNRIYFGVGYKMRLARVEFGYLWRYERKRSSPDASDHVIRFKLQFDSKGKRLKLGGN